MTDSIDFRKSKMEIGEIYFWTATINGWQLLLKDNSFKNVIVDSLRHLSNLSKIDVFSFVIMPNHVHIIWRLNEMNGKESPHTSFLKFTAHDFKKRLATQDENTLTSYVVDAVNKDYEFWKRDSLAILLFTRDVTYQKMDYIHHNPCADKWQLADEPSDYFYSSAKFYEKGLVIFRF